MKNRIPSARLFAAAAIGAVLAWPGSIIAETAGSNSIISGNSSSTASVSNGQNLNVNDTGLVSTTGEASSTPTVNGDISADNFASTTNAVGVGAESGKNSASSTGDAFISTGSAGAGADIVNVSNTNITDSEGSLVILNNFFGDFGSIDLSGASSSPQCSGPCPGFVGQFSSNASNTTSILNDVVVRSGTGSNQASSTGDGSIISGDAYGYANVVNLANTNISGANYMLLVFNNFQDWQGSLIFPSAAFFSGLFGNPQSLSGSTTVNNVNSADIGNNVSAEADTGGNTASSSESSVISTGNASALSNVVNQVNGNYFGSDSFMVIVRVFGNWTGSVYNAPPGIYWQQTQNGVELFSDPARASGFGSSTGTQSGPAAGAIATSSSQAVSNENSAWIRNNVKVYALSGGNKLSSSGNGLIQTGNAKAVANVINIVNTNILGRNWTLALINIFGNWNGSISFGQPNLWLGSWIEGADRPVKGSNPVFHFTIWNNGNADAHDVKINLRSGNPLYLSFNRAVDDLSSDSSLYSWRVGTIPAGHSVDVAYTAKISDHLPFGATGLPVDVKVTSAEPEANPADNTDQLFMWGMNYADPGKGGTFVPLTRDPILEVEDTNDADQGLLSSSTVKYNLVVSNHGGPAYHSVLSNTVKNEQGKVIARQTWDLGEIKENEQIKVNFTTLFNASTTPGVYTSYAEVRAVGRHPSLNPFYGYFTNSNQASSSVTIYAMSPLKPVFPEDVEQASTTASSTEKVASSSPVSLNAAQLFAKHSGKLLSVKHSEKSKISSYYYPGTSK